MRQNRQQQQLPSKDETTLRLMKPFCWLFPASVTITKDKITLDDGKGNKEEISISKTRKLLEDFFK